MDKVISFLSNEKFHYYFEIPKIEKKKINKNCNLKQNLKKKIK